MKESTKTPPVVLIVDDDEDLRLLISYALSKNDCKVLEAEDGPSGLAIACTERPDLILLDRQLPYLNGLQVLKNLRANSLTRPIPVIFLSAMSSSAERVQGLEAGAYDYLVKPFDPAELVLRVQNTLDRTRSSGAATQQAAEAAREASPPAPEPPTEDTKSPTEDEAPSAATAASAAPSSQSPEASLEDSPAREPAEGVGTEPTPPPLKPGPPEVAEPPAAALPKAPPTSRLMRRQLALARERPDPLHGQSVRDIATVLALLGCLALAIGLMWLDPTEELKTADPAALQAAARAKFAPLSQVPKPASERAILELGRQLFHEPRLSADGKRSCATCHPLDRSGADGKVRTGSRNVPTVLNSSSQVALLWDGRAESVEAQISLALTDPARLGWSRVEEAAEALNAVPGYREAFREAFPGEPEGVTARQIATAAGVFLRSLQTPSRFDAYLEGDARSLSGPETEGLATFVDVGCVDCHAGPLVGGESFRKLGELVPLEVEDPGRFLVTGLEEDRGLFKVPSLRNVRRTGPYLHDGSVADLSEVTRLMARHQLDRTLSEQQVAAIVTFLDSLTGELDAGSIGVPELPGAAAAYQPKTREELQALATHAGKTFGALPAAKPLDDVARLGQVLFFDPRLSKNKKISCNTCHPLDRFGTDGLSKSVGHDGIVGERNASTVLNASLHFAQFWDGRAETLEDQALEPMLNPKEMGMPGVKAIEARVRSIKGYRALFAAAFPKARSEWGTGDQIAAALSAFERRLLTPGRFDAFMGGDLDALTPREADGLGVFFEVGCTTCHVGPALGGTMFQKLGLARPYATADLGRAKVTGKPWDRGSFKVPSLRNVTRTGPYLHDGSIPDVAGAVRLMAEHQLGVDLPQREVDDIVAFLASLEGELPPDLISAPELPE